MGEMFNSEVTVKIDEKAMETVKENLGQRLAQACVLVVDDAKVECPVDTGRLQGSITYEVEGTDGYVGSNVEYAPYVHEGTSKMAARPFLMNAIEKNKNKIAELFKGAV